MSKLISIIGPPASGKTTLAEHLAAALPARLLREDFAGNPFLAEFFLGRGELALPSQLYFLFSRLQQLQGTSWPADGFIVTDYGFCQDAVYARASLSASDLAAYERLALPVGQRVKQPDLLICLDAEEPVLLGRIARRGRHYERSFTAAFLEGLRRQYQAIAAASVCPVLHVPASAELLGQTWRKGFLRQVKEAMT